MNGSPTEQGNAAVSIHEKYAALKDYLRELGSVAVAFSSGVDSTFLLRTAHEVLGDKVIAITANSHMFPRRELEEAKKFCAAEGVRHIIVDHEELEVDGFKSNPVNRCYICKHALFEKVKAIAAENNVAYVVEGSNMDDNGDYRPGLQAIDELDIKSPLRHVKLWKDEIRQLSKEIGLSTWNKPSFACLASRFVYGETISAEKLTMIDRAEQFLLDKGFTQVRVRIHDRIARIEILPDEFDKVMSLRKMIMLTFKAIGFQYVTLDLQGYRSGSMNETLVLA